MIEGKANELPDLQVFTTVIKYCMFIIIIPAVSFFFAKSVIFDGLLALDPITSNVYSAAVAVIVLHIALGLYICKAYYEAENVRVPAKPVKKD